MTSQTIEGFQLSPQQRRLWQLQGEGEVAYRAQCAAEIKGEVDTALLARVVRELVGRHELLRTRFVSLPGMAFPLQSITPEPVFVSEVHDLSAAGGNAPSVESLWQELATLRFDLSRGPALHYVIAKTGPERYVFILCLPALCVDSTGLERLVVEIWHRYVSLCNEVGEDESSIQYADISEWLNELLTANERAAGRGFWTRQEALRSRASVLPLEQSAVGVTTFTPHVLVQEIDRDLVVAMDTAAARHGVSIEDVLLAGWQCLLARLTSSSRVTIGLACDGRKHEELRHVVGLFEKYVPLVGDIAPDKPFLRALTEAAAGARDCRLWQEYFDPTGGQTDTSDPVCFEFRRQSPAHELPGSMLSFKKLSAYIDRFKLSLSCARVGDQTTLNLIYDTHRYSEDYVRLLAKQYIALLTSALRDLECAVERLDLVGNDERRRLLVEVNATERTYPSQKCLHQLFEEQVARSPDAIAVRYRDQQLTYAELNMRANQLARYLQTLGARPEIPVGMCLERSPDMIVALLAVLKSGAAYVPLDPVYPEERLRFMVEDSGMGLLLTQEGLAPRFGAIAVRCVNVDGEWQRIATEATHNPTSGAVPTTLAYVIYTSGSSGKPKGVLIEHRGLVNYLSWCIDAYDVARGQGAPVHSSISFDATITSIYPSLLVGRTIVLVPEGEEVEGLSRLLRASTAFSLIKITPAHLDLLSQMLPDEPIAGRPGFLVIGGEALFGKTVRFWRKNADHARLINEYGPTETVVGCCVYEVPAQGAVPASIPIGRPIANTQIYILDRQLQPVAVGVVGEIYIGGAGVARGYLNRPELTRERFIDDPFIVGEGRRLYKTGDLARYLLDGNLEYLGRADEQIKLHGFRIEPGEIESALVGHAAVQEAVVLADTASDGGARLVAFVTTDNGGDIDANDLRRFLEQRLPKYMVPSLYLPVSSMPLTPNGKVDRKKLLQSESLHPRSLAVYVAPATAHEQLLARLWAEVLKLERVGVDDNFFDLGGDSIRSIQILAKLKQHGFEVSLQQLFQYQTVADMARVLAGAASAATDDGALLTPFALISPVDRAKLPAGLADAYPVSALQLGMLFHSAFAPGKPLYIDIDSVHLRAPFDAVRLHDTLRFLVERHAILRTSFDMSTYSEPLQLLAPTVDVPLPVEDLRHQSPAEQEQRIAACIEHERTQGFDWKSAPLLRFAVFIRSDESFHLVFSRHHAILDGWSTAVLLTEMVQYYLHACGKNVPPLLPAPQTGYRDFVVSERRVVAAPEAKRYWVDKLTEVAVSRLPRWRATAPHTDQERRLGRFELKLTDEIAAGAVRLAQQTRTTLKSVLLAAHMKILSVLGGNRDVVTGVVSTGRVEQQDGERALGLFLNTLPFRLQLRGGSWIELVQEVFKTECEALPFRRYPLAEIQRALGGQALFEVLFNFIHFHVYEGVARLADVEILDASSHEETNFTLLVNFSQDPVSRAVHLSFYYDANELGQEQIQLLGQYYHDTLRHMVQAPNSAYQSHSLLTSFERQKLLVDWNRTDAGYPAGQCIHQLFEAQVERSPTAVALQHGVEQLTYAELNEHANRLAHFLRAEGIGAEAIVGICMERTPDLVVALLAVLKAGAAYVPLDPAYPRERLTFMLQDARAALVLAHGRWRELLEGSGVRVCYVDGERARFAAMPVHNLTPPESSRRLAYVIYTSGSTGQPKGVAIEHRSTVVLLYWARDTFTAEQRAGMLASTSICFDLSVFEIFVPISWGGRIVLAENALQLPALPDKSVVSFINTVPSAMTELVRLKQVPPSVKVVALAGEPLPNALAQSVYQAGVESVFNLYGPSEDTTYSTFCRIEPGSQAPVTIGRPVANTRLYILDPDLQPVPVAVAGELYIGGDGLARSYLHRPELTQEKFIRDPFSADPSARLYRTGDLARYRHDGEVEFLGRLDHQIKVRGYRIELGEIEAALLKHSSVRAAVVVARDEKPSGKRLVAYFVAATPAPTVAELRRFLQQTLPGYMIPAAFVMLDALPLTPNGKIDRRALPAPEGSAVASAQVYVAPASETEKKIAAIWGELLGVERVGVNDNFFDLGGHSLHLLQARGKLSQLPNADAISLVDLFVYPTVRALANYIDQPQTAPQVTSQTINERATRQKNALQKQRQKKNRELGNVR